MSILKDKFFGMAITCAIGDNMGAYMDFMKKEGKSIILTCPLSIPQDIRGSWTEITLLMVCQFDSLINNKSLNDSFALMTENGLTGFNGFNTSTCSQDSDGLLFKRNLKCNHNSKCLGLTGALAMYHYKNYEEGYLQAYNNILAKCEICQDACKLYYSIIDLILHGANKKDILQIKHYLNLNLCLTVLNVLDLKDVHLYELEGKDDVLSVLKMILYCFSNTNNIREALIMAINNSSAPNKTGPLLGQLVGGYYGLTNINEDWLVIKNQELIVNPVNLIVKFLKK
jgi:ADP-ribosylglycohydrolase